MWYLVYNILLLIASPVILAVLWSKPRCRRGLPQRLGMMEPQSPPDGKPLVWVHAVSLGEVVAVAPLVKELHRRHPDCRFIVSTVTETGREAVEQRLAGVAEHRYAPLDFPWVVSRTVESLCPVLYLFVETELWPNLLRHLNRRGVPTIMVNGRISSRSFARQVWPLVRAFYATMLRTLTLCLMQSERDAQRIMTLGADPRKVKRTGNLKFDQPAPALRESPHAVRLLGLPESVPLIVAGSTHQGEEEILVDAYCALSRVHPEVRLVLAPRHIERAEQVEAMVVAKGCTVRRRSTVDSGAPRLEPPAQVTVLDSRGELAGLYQDAIIAFVGGTLVPVGGHNLLEPAVCGKPVLFGPYTDHCAEIAELLLQSGGGRRVSASSLTQDLVELVTQPGKRSHMGGAARSVVDQNQGAMGATVEAIESLFVSSSSSTTSALSRTPYPIMAGR
ncbi:MAG TPA: 3-deoxy-D-manno-octulosonic acid transferase [Nitrospira sp.]|nr:3-deoxy-D-manno-octulosonic acid transferase [Nitrospira sp.]